MSNTNSSQGADTPASRVIAGEWHVRYNYPVGEVGAKFFDALKQRKIMATRCTASGISYLPPRAYCERSFEACDGWVEAGHEGAHELGCLSILSALVWSGFAGGLLVAQRLASSLARQAAALLEGDVAHDAVEPGAQGGLTAEAGQAMVNRNEDFLRGVVQLGCRDAERAQTAPNEAEVLCINRFKFK